MNVGTMELSGVRGWLAWFVIALCFLGPLVMWGNLGVAFDTLEGKYPGLVQAETWQHYKTYRYIVLGLIVAARWSAGYMLTNVMRRKSVQYTIAVLWGTAVIFAIGPYIAAVAAFGNAPSSAAQTAVTDFIKGAALALVWSAYLIRSKRVTNTYP